MYLSRVGFGLVDHRNTLLQSKIVTFIGAIEVVVGVEFLFLCGGFYTNTNKLV